MTQYERRAWFTVAVLFFSMLIIGGPPFGSTGILFTPILNEFKLTRAEVGGLSGFLFVAAALSTPIGGWLLDRFEAWIVMSGSTLVIAAALYTIHAAHSYRTLAIGYAMLGAGGHTACLLPLVYVITNWFGEKRGLALGIGVCSMAVGPALAAVNTQRLVTAFGWRNACVILAIPMVVIVVPLLALTIRSHPPKGIAVTRASEVPKASEGLTLAEAAHTRSFWLLALISFCEGFVTVGVAIHLAASLIARGYKPSTGALALSLSFAGAVAGTPTYGWLGDKIKAKYGITIAMVAMALITFFLAGSPPILAVLVLSTLFGAMHQGPLIFVPVAVAESLGLKYFGTITGWIAAGGSAGAIIGPPIMGRVIDTTGSYFLAFGLLVLAATVGALASLGCKSAQPQAAVSPELVGSAAI